ncbi:MAG: hypothetical protein C9356_08580 [Oleiphilus sp.]|nr:MAG: hypothetical protein C9356_08580 [Oleiphilus sp.]
MANPGSDIFQSLVGQAQLFSRQGNYANAVKCYRQLLSIDGDNAAVHFNLANALGQIGQVKEAIQHYQHAIRIDSKLLMAQFSMGLCYEQLGDLRSAELAYLEATKDKSVACHAFLRLSTLMLKIRNHERGLAFAKEGIAQDQENTALLLTYVSHASALKQHQNAKQYAERVLVIEPDNIHAKKYLGETLCRLSETDKGLTLLSEASDHSTEGLMACFPSLVFYTDSKDVNRLAHYADKVQEILKQGNKLPAQLAIELAFPLARYLHDVGQYDAALHFLNTGNSLKRQTYKYDSSRMDAYFSRSLQYAESLKTAQLQKPANPALIFVVGLPRSGTTLVEQVLSAHSQVYGCGELELANQARAKIERTFNPDLSSGEEFSELVCEFRSFYLKGLEGFPEKPVYIDKMPDNFHHIPILLAAFPNSKIVHCRRQIEENAFSIYRQNFQGMHPYAYDLSELKHYVESYRSLFGYWDRLYAASIHDLVYEEMVQDQEGVTRQLLEFCELPFESSCLSFHKNKNVVNTASSAQVKKEIYTSSLKVVSKYPEFLSEWTRIQVAAAAGKGPSKS